MRKEKLTIKQMRAAYVEAAWLYVETYQSTIARLEAALNEAQRGMKEKP